jgi:hypothetical protein
MTLCIAAACVEKKEPRIVTCIDWKTSSALGSSQTFDKFKKICPGWIALMAGKASRAKEMVAAVSKVFKGAPEITGENAATLVKIATITHARGLRDEYCGFRFGLSYEDFQKWCATVNPVLAKPYIDELSQIKFGASLLVAGFVKDDKGKPRPLICKATQSNSEVVVEEHFGAIGEGISVAVPPLLRREYDWEETQLPKAIYYLYEAKTLAEIIDSVGPSTSVDVLYPGGEVKSLETIGYKYYDELLKEFGPKPRVTGIEWNDKYLGPFDEDEEDEKDTKQPSPKSKSQKLKSKQ